MASPVDTTVKWARSSMPGAPVLTRAAGSLISLLDALLVNGWGQQTATSVVVSDGVATATFPSDHAAARHAVVLVDGVTGTLAGLNGEQKVIAVEPNKIKWATTEANGTATGTITVKMAAAGWNKPFTGTNLAAYKSASPAAHGQFLRVADTAVEAARAIGYENMTAISTGTGPFPTSAQVNGGYYWGKSSDTSGTNATPWVFASDGRIFYLCTVPSFNNSPGILGNFAIVFGDLLSFSAAGDPWATLISGAADSGWSGYGALYTWVYNGSDLSNAVPRQHAGTGTAIRGLTICELDLSFGGSPPTLPDPISGAIPFGRVIYRDAVGRFPRAALPGVLHCPCTPAETLVSNGEIIELPDGRAMVTTLSAVSTYSSSSMNVTAFDITGPWR